MMTITKLKTASESTGKALKGEIMYSESKMYGGALKMLGGVQGHHALYR